MHSGDFKIVWLSWHPNHYNDFLFCEISKIDGISLEVYYLKSVIGKYPWSLKYQKSFNFYTANNSRLPWIKFFRAILDQKTDLVVIAGWNNINQILALLLLGGINKKYIIWSDTPKIHFKRSGIKKFVRGIYLNYIINKSWYIFTTGSTGIKSFQRLGIPLNKLLNFPFATELDFFKPKKNKYRREDKEFILLCSGRLDINHKGQDLIIKAVKELIDLEYTIKLRIAGVGPDEKKIKSLSKELEISDSVEFLGWLEFSSLPDYYNSGHIFIHSSHFDPFPNAVLEAMACGLPVIGSDQAGSVLDRVRNSYNGYIHKDNDVKNLTQQILEIIQKPESLITLGKNARETALNHSVKCNLSIINQLKSEFFD